MSGHSTSVTLEDEFWAALKDIAKTENCSVRSIISIIDKNRSPDHNLSSLVRLYILKWYQTRMLTCHSETEWQAAKHFRDTYFFGPYGIEDPYTWTFHHKDHAHLVLYQGTEIIGYAHIQFWPDQRAAMRIIVIDENKRNQGLGSRFLAFIEKWLKRLNIQSIHVESRQSSLKFYLKNGYTDMPFNDPDGHESDPHDVSVGKVL